MSHCKERKKERKKKKTHKSNTIPKCDLYRLTMNNKKAIAQLFFAELRFWLSNVFFISKKLFFYRVFVLLLPNVGEETRFVQVKN